MKLWQIIKRMTNGKYIENDKFIGRNENYTIYLHVKHMSTNTLTLEWKGAEENSNNIPINTYTLTTYNFKKIKRREDD